MKRRRWRWWLLGVVIFFLLFFIAAEFTSRSRFCSVCHYMKPFYESWKVSSHGQIECQVCHYPPGLRSKLRAKVEGLLQVGRYWTKLYLKSKPWAEIPDEACLRPGCHDKRLLEGRVKFQTVVFDHKIHFEDLRRGKRLRCTSCHSQIVQGEHITVTESSCFICHFKQSEHYPRIADCAHCHHQEDLLANKSRYDHQVSLQANLPCQRCHVEVTLGDGAVPRENCYKCHWERDRLERYAETDLIHSTHITVHKIECNQCHLEIQHKIIKDVEIVADCRSCHTGFHEAQKILYAGQGGKGLTHPTPSIKFEKGLSCQGCHVLHEEMGSKLLPSETLKAGGQACETCHGKGFARLLTQWEEATEKEILKAKGVLEKAQNELRRSPSSKKDEASKLIEEAAFNIAVVEKGKAVHNMEYSRELLEASLHLMGDAMKLIGSSYQPPTITATANLVPASCGVCHQGIEEITAGIYGLEFAHRTHLEKSGLECKSCHSLSPQHGKLIATRNSCATCHHGQEQKNCQSCHQLQSLFYQGGSLLALNIPADSMAEAGVECSSCHRLEKNIPQRTDPAACLECHEEDYPRRFKEQQGEIQKKIILLEELLAGLKNIFLSPEEKAALESDQKILDKIRDDGSAGAHNSSFINSWLSGSIEKWSSRQKEKRSQIHEKTKLP